MKKLTIDQVEFQIIQHSEDMPVKGNVCATGDKGKDLEIETKIIKRLENGDLWAWCTVEVRATFQGLEASDYLGACSYRNEKGFIKGGYYKDMEQRAFEELQGKVANLIGALS
jgi:hypothetical protein